jgi:hypothetical protein
MKVLPSSISPTNYLLSNVHFWNQEGNHFIKREILTRVVSAVATTPFALLSASYNLSAFTIKAPFVLVKYTMGLIPINYEKGHWVQIMDYFPEGFELTEMFFHAYKVFVFTSTIVVSPGLGFIYPRANIGLHSMIGLFEYPKIPRQIAPVQHPVSIISDPPFQNPFIPPPPLTPPPSPLTNPNKRLSLPPRKKTQKPTAEDIAKEAQQKLAKLNHISLEKIEENKKIRDEKMQQDDEIKKGPRERALDQIRKGVIHLKKVPDGQKHYVITPSPKGEGF